MVKRFILKVIGIVLAVCFLLTIKNVDFEGIISLVDNTPITLDTLEKLNFMAMLIMIGQNYIIP